MDHGIYGIDLKSLEYVALASGLTKEQFAVSADHSRAAWQENTGIWDSQTIQIIDLDTGDKTQVGRTEWFCNEDPWFCRKRLHLWNRGQRRLSDVQRPV